MGKTIGLTFDEPVFICPHCGKAYKTADGLEKHIQKEHTEPPAGSTPPAE